MKALMVGWELPPHHSGGLGVACFQLCQALAKQGVELEFMLPYNSGDHDDIDFMRVHSATTLEPERLSDKWSAYDSSTFEVLRLHETGQLETDGRKLSIAELEGLYVDAIVGAAREIDFDVIHAHDWLTIRAAARLKRATGKPLIMHVHATEFDRAGGEYGNSQIHEIESLGFQVADRVITVSLRVKEILVHRYGVDPEKIEVQYNGVQIPAVVKQSPAYSDNTYQYLWQMRQHGYQIVGNVGRITRMKNLHSLVRAMATVVKFRPRSLLVIVGSGDQREEMIEFAADLGIGRHVLFIDFAKGAAWRDVFDMFDVFVMPSISEPFGITPLEAACFGVPTIVTKQSGVAEVFKNCLKVDFWDDNMLSTMIYEVLASPALAEELRHYSQLEVDELDWREPARNISHLYQGVIEGVA